MEANPQENKHILSALWFFWWFQNRKGKTDSKMGNKTQQSSKLKPGSQKRVSTCCSHENVMYPTVWVVNIYSHMRNRCRCRAFTCDSDFYCIVPLWCLLASTDERKIKMRFPQEVAFSFSLVEVSPPPHSVLILYTMKFCYLQLWEKKISESEIVETLRVFWLEAVLSF